MISDNGVCLLQFCVIKIVSINADFVFLFSFYNFCRNGDGLVRYSFDLEVDYITERIIGKTL